MQSGSLLSDSGRQKSLRESDLKKAFSSQTSRIPNSFFLALAGGALALSLGLALSQKKKKYASFVGQWVPTFLLLGIYRKIASDSNVEKLDTKSMYH
jgi:hypothetical protein